MKLTVVGCSPAWSNPGGAQSGYLVEDGARVLLDCGPGVLARLREREAWPHLDAVVLTHFHLDHWGDLVPWTFGASFGPGRGVEPPELWLPPGGEARLRTLGAQLGFGSLVGEVFRLREFADRRPFEVGGLRITAVRLAHYEQAAFGLRVENGRAAIAYSADTAPTDGLVELAADADLFLCEATLAEPEPPDDRGHMTADEALAASREAGAHRLVVIHRPEELPLPPGLERAHDGDAWTL